MLEKLRVVFAIPELRQKILLTLLLLGVYRIGYQIRLPVVKNTFQQSASDLNSFLEKVSVFAATDLRSLTIFGLGIMPYISASIIFQLLGTFWPPIERLRKEGEAGRKKINEYTRYLTVLICVIQSWVYLRYMGMDGQTGRVAEQFFADGTQTLSFGWQIAAVAIMTCGTVFLMWLGEQIDEYGIGNGISLLIMAGIVAQMPKAIWDIRQNMQSSLSGLTQGKIGPDVLLVLAVLFVAVVFAVVFITLAQRRIPTQSAKHVRGRRVYGGTKQYLPLRLNQSGVMPIIFSSSLLMIPFFLFGQLGRVLGPNSTIGTWLGRFGSLFSPGQGFIYSLSYILLIYFFCYFWTAITFNPKDMAENLKDNGSFIPGYRPGNRTATHLEQVMLRITYVGAAFLAVIAVIPTIISNTITQDFVTASFFGGTGLLIIVSVALDLVQKIDSHLVMRNYPGLLDSDK